MRDALKELTQEQVSFICAECSVTEDELFSMDEDTLYDKVYDVMCDIEVDETMASIDEGEVEESERCILASDIVTILGNALAEEEGFYEEQERLYGENE